jgi:large subunit ribosomal protein L4e
MSARPTITVYGHTEGSESTASLPLPDVLTVPIRPDFVNSIHNAVAKNNRQARGVSRLAGHQTSAESWGTGRAVARIPRVGGSGTSRSGQGAFGNMCRKGHMFAPLKVYRKWHQKTNLKEKRHAVASALASSAVAPLVMARGHRIEDVKEIPLVVDTLDIKSTKDLLKALLHLGCEQELKRVALSKKIRTGRGKMRNRRYVKRKGPLVIHDASEEDVVLGARNLLGVDTCKVQKLNILELAPGGHIGRFVIWTKKAFQSLNKIFGTFKVPGSQKGGYRINRSMMQTADLSRLINSDQIQSVIRAKTTNVKVNRKKNALKSTSEMRRLNPFEAKRKEIQQQQQDTRTKNRKQILAAKRTHKLGREFLADFVKNVDESQKRDEEIWYKQESGSEEEGESDEDDAPVKGAADDDEDDE